MEKMEPMPQENEDRKDGEELIIEKNTGQVRTKEDVDEERKDNFATDAWREQK